MKKKQNKTTLIVRDAMKATSKDVRAPKAVRLGLAKPIIKPSDIIDCIFLNDSIKIKGKKIVSISTFRNQIRRVPIIDELSYRPDKVQYVIGPMYIEDVIVEVDLKPKKIKLLLDLFQEQKRISFNVFYTNDTKVLSSGFIKEINYSEDKLSITYCPERFSVL